MAETMRFVTDSSGDGPRERRVFRAQVKVGTHPGSIGLFLQEPVVGSVVEVVEDGDDAAVTRAIRVTVDRYDDILDRYFVSRR